MIAPNEKPDTEPELTSKDIHAILCICLKMLGGIGIPEEAIKNFPEDTKLNASYDHTNKVWYLSVPRKRKRGIVKPQKKLFVPN